MDQRLDAERHHDVDGAADFDAKELGRHYAHDRDRHAVDRHPRADHARGAVESPLPQAIADDGDRAVRSAARPIVGFRERAAEQRRHAERREIAPAREDPVGWLPFSPFREVEARCHRGEAAVERRQVRREAVPHRGVPAEAGGEAASRRGVVRDGEEPVRIGDRQRPHQQAVDHAEDRGVRADAESERQDDDRGESWRSPEHPDGEPYVLPKRIERGDPACVTRCRDRRHGVLPPVSARRALAYRRDLKTYTSRLIQVVKTELSRRGRSGRFGSWTRPSGTRFRSGSAADWRPRGRRRPGSRRCRRRRRGWCWG